MATPRRSVVLVVLAVLLAAGGAAYYFFFIFSKDERLREAQTQVVEWEERWVTARACLLGDKPLAAEIGDAITAREIELGTAKAAMGDCSRAIGRLTRPEGNDSGIEAVEQAWEQVEATAAAVAKSYLAHLRAPLEDETLVEALVRLRKARGTLRRVVALTMEDAAMGPAVAELVLEPLGLEGQPVTELAGVGHGAKVRGRVESGQRWFSAQLTKTGATLTIEAAKTNPEVVRSAPAGTWGATVAFETQGARELMKLTAGEIDDTGAIAKGAPVATAPPTLIAGAALDAPTARAVLYVANAGATPGIFAAISKDRGATWQKTLLTASADGNIFADGEGVADVIWRERGATLAEDDDREVPGDRDAPDGLDDREPASRERAPGSLAWQRLQAAQLPALGAAVHLPDTELVQACAAPTAPWVLVRRDSALQLLRLDRRDQPVPVPDASMTSILDCDDDAALLGNALTLMACQRGQCSELPARGTRGLGAVIAGTPMFAATRRSLLALYTPAAPTRLLRMPDAAKLYAMLALDGRPYLVFKQPSGALVGGSLPQ